MFNPSAEFKAASAERYVKRCTRVAALLDLVPEGQHEQAVRLLYELQLLADEEIEDAYREGVDHGRDLASNEREQAPIPTLPK